MMRDSSQPVPPLLPDDVHIWLLNIDAHAVSADAFASILSADERIKADKYHFADGRNTALLSRGILRFLIGKYLGADPRTLQFQYNTFGKPSLAEGGDLSFSVSHTTGALIYAFTIHRRVGIDIEDLTRGRDAALIAKSRFTASEQKLLFSAEPSAIPELFLRLWTMKEAVMKALGEGCNIPLNSFSVAPGENFTCSICESSLPGLVCENWHLEELPVSKKHTASFAVENTNAKTQIYSLDLNTIMQQLPAFSSLHGQ